MWKPTIRIADEELENKIKNKLKEDDKSLQDVLETFLKSWVDGQEEVQLTSKEEVEIPNQVQVLDKPVFGGLYGALNERVDTMDWEAYAKIPLKMAWDDED